MWWLGIIATVLAVTTTTSVPSAIPILSPIDAVDVEAVYPVAVVVGSVPDIPSWDQLDETLKGYSVILFLVSAFMPLGFLSFIAFFYRN